MLNKIIKEINNLLFVIKNARKVANHHYASKYSLLKFIYYSFLRINRFYVYETNLKNYNSSLMLSPSYQVLQPSIEELSRMRKGKVLPREFYYDQIHGLVRCYVVLCHNEIAYIHWVIFSNEYSRFLKLSPDIAEFSYYTTLDKFRGDNLSAKMMSYISKDLKEEAIKKIIIVTHESNIASIRSIEKAGFVKRYEIKSIGPFNKKLFIS